MPQRSEAAQRSQKMLRRAGVSRQRRPEKGGYPRSEETRTKLIAAALEVFGEGGFKSASTRAIAKRAKVTLPVLAYHFGGKAGLYQACADYITSQIANRVAPALARVEDTLARRRIPRAELIQYLVNILATMAEMGIGPETERRGWVEFIAREQANPTAAFETVYTGIMSRVIETCAKIIGRLLRLPVNHPVVRLRAMFCLGQVFMLRMARAAVLRTLGWENYEDQHLSTVQTALRNQLEDLFR